MSVRRFQFTPEYIEDLHPSEVFVFGSNAAGNHYGGAARLAFDKFGAVWGVGEGLRGNSYAIPTLNSNMTVVSGGSLRYSLKEFLRVVECNPGYTFLLTKIGCGIAGWSVETVARIFWEVASEFYKGKWYAYVGSLPENLVIPVEFHDHMPADFLKNEKFNKLNSDLLFIEKQISRIREAIAVAGDPEEYERLHDEQVDAESQRNILVEEIREFISEIRGATGD